MPELIVVAAGECHDLRESVLRPGQPPDRWMYPQDEESRAMHFAMKRGSEVLGVASLLPDVREGGTEAWRIRGMAVADPLRGTGIGKTLLLAAQAVVEQRGGGLWCNARTTVEGFYAAHGFERHGDVFEIEGAGPHVVMTWHPTVPPPEDA